MLASQYGLHKDRDDIWWLLQKAGASNAIGMPPEGTDQAELAGYIGPCPHDIWMTSDDKCAVTKDVIEFSLGEFLFPLPLHRRKIAYIEVPESKLGLYLPIAMKLQQMFSPCRDLAAPIWSGDNLLKWYQQRTNSNLVTPIIYGPSHMRSQSICEKLMDLTLVNNSRVLFMTTEAPSYFRRHDLLELNSADFEDLDPFMAVPDDQFRKFGAIQLRKFMRGD